MNVFLVGGAVRDKLLGIRHTEQDWLVLGSTPEHMLAEGFVPVGKDFPVFLHPRTKEEYALARTERKTAKGYKGFSFFTSPDISIEEDLLRRDLTINAMAEDAQGNLIDPYGGQQDLQKRILRHVSPAFVEDPLRVLRLARFAACYAHLGFSVAPETLLLVKTIAASGELETLVAERVWQELHKALASDAPQVFFEVLRAGDALKVVFPEVDALFGVPQRAEYHPEVDSGIHVMMSLQQAVLLKANVRTRFAVLCHDFGKASTPVENLPKHIGHEARSKAIAAQFCARLKVPNEFEKLALQVAQYHLQCHTAFELRAATILKLFKKLSAFNDETLLKDFLLACEADAKGRLGLENRAYPQAEFLSALFKAAASVKSDAVDAERFQGKHFGEQLDRLRVAAIEQAKQNYEKPL